MTAAAADAPESPIPPALRLVRVQKQFAGVPVLRNVSFAVASGEVVMLIGENGAGKSTLKNIICGLLAPDQGTIEIDGVAHAGLTSGQAEALGIGVIHQELSLFPNLSVTENIFIGHFGRPLGRLNWPALHAKARALLCETLGTDIDPRAPVETLSIGQRQMVEVAKALHGSSRILVLDEPTTCLTLPERERLFALVRRLKASGLAIVYITHFMDEVYALADRIVVLRDGAMVGDGTPAEIDRRRLGTLMAGRELDIAAADLAPVPDAAPVRLRVAGLSDGRLLDGIGFSIRAGEVLGLAGLVGSGRSEIAEALFGLRRTTAGSVEIDGAPFPMRSPRAALARGLVLVSEDRRHDQAFLGRPLRENVTAPLLGRLAGAAGFASATRERRLVDGLLRRHAVRHPGREAPMAALSGGNQQKVIIGRWIEADPRIAILDEPTKGVDIGARGLIHRLVADLARRGVAILLISSDLPELLALSHRLLVLHKGRIVAELDPRRVDGAGVIALASSGRPVDVAGAA